MFPVFQVFFLFRCWQKVFVLLNLFSVTILFHCVTMKCCDAFNVFKFRYFSYLFFHYLRLVTFLVHLKTVLPIFNSSGRADSILLTTDTISRIVSCIHLIYTSVDKMSAIRCHSCRNVFSNPSWNIVGNQMRHLNFFVEFCFADGIFFGFVSIVRKLVNMIMFIIWIFPLPEKKGLW